MLRVKAIGSVMFVAVASISALQIVRGAAPAPLPNIVIIYADDVGYGDVGCYGAKSIPTPNIDRLAREGLRFTSGYATSATCTPSRYSLFTGEYAWRRPGTGVAPPNATALIEEGRTTLASVLKDAGYDTAITGKWHLGLGEPPKPDWSGIIKPGPLEVGFNYSYIIPTTNDRVPCVFVEGHHVDNLDPQDPVDVYDENPDNQPTGITQRDDLKMDWSHGHNQSVVNGIGRIGFMTGGHAARWVDEEMTAVMVNKAIQFMRRDRDQPFFLFYSAHQNHVPRVPNERYVGATPHGPRGDAIVELDAGIGPLLQTLDDLGVADETLVIFTSDNGPVLDDGYQDEAVERLGDHQPAGPWRGGKYSRFEGGTRVPFVVHWPGRVAPGVSDALVSQVDFLRSLARLVGQGEQVTAEVAPDSQDVLQALLGESPTGRQYVVEHGRGALAIRQGKWKYIEPNRGPAVMSNTGTETANSPLPQLYDLEADPSETRNLAETHPEVVEQLQVVLAEERGASTAAK